MRGQWVLFFGFFLFVFAGVVRSDSQCESQARRDYDNALERCGNAQDRCRDSSDCPFGYVCDPSGRCIRQHCEWREVSRINVSEDRSRVTPPCPLSGCNIRVDMYGNWKNHGYFWKILQRITERNTCSAESRTNDYEYEICKCSW